MPPPLQLPLPALGCDGPRRVSVSMSGMDATPEQRMLLGAGIQLVEGAGYGPCLARELDPAPSTNPALGPTVATESARAR
eukprot:217612-Chlamydomonas_euryale.AAC.1